MLIRIFATEILQENLTIEQIPVRLRPLVEDYIKHLIEIKKDKEE